MIIPVNVHSSQFPEQVGRELAESLRTREINHKFHYESRRQAQQWLELHRRYSPSRNDLESRAGYEQAFIKIATLATSPAVHVIGLGCGAGLKDFMLLQQLRKRGKMLVYSACDASLPLVLTARQRALTLLDERHVHDLVADFVTADDLQRIFITQTTGNSTRIINFLGMIPNFEPAQILPRLASLIRAQDILVFSANLAPGDDYRAGVEKVLPQYDNAETRAWLMSLLIDLGFDAKDGRLRFEIEENANETGLIRVVARFDLKRDRVIHLDEEKFTFREGDSLRVFYSYRHTPDTVRAWLGKEGIDVLEQTVSCEGQEGLFICRRKAAETAS
ncbi:MAG: L-histidine N(alpha)-methyltransferase [Verrucomicrobiae bacterium]|jgi:L-histidine N-alpha-methyltransferase|nr:L-histidine N(alpha)-methyltransferase [Verrucomicrobiae bacterium]